MDAIITDAFDSASRAIEDTEHILKEEHASLAADFSSNDKRDKMKRKNVCGRGVRVPQESSERSKYLLPLVSSQILTYFQQELSAAIESEQGFYQYDLSLNEAETASKRTNNSRRTHTIVFQYPGNGHYYFALNFQSFSKFICD